MATLHVATVAAVTAEAIQQALRESGHLAVFLHAPRPERVCKVEPREEGPVQVNFPHQYFGAGSNTMRFPTLAVAVESLRAWLFSDQVQVGDEFAEVINQGLRYCEVIVVKKLRYRIEFEMPACTQQGWRRGVVVCGRLFYPAGGAGNGA